jgi:hypothetical protein
MHPTSDTNLKKYSILAPPDPTYWPTSISNRPDILDIFITFIPSSSHNIIKNLLEPCSRLMHSNDIEDAVQSFTETIESAA